MNTSLYLQHHIESTLVDSPDPSRLHGARAFATSLQHGDGAQQSFHEAVVSIAFARTSSKQHPAEIRTLSVTSITSTILCDFFFNRSQPCPGAVVGCNPHSGGQRCQTWLSCAEPVQGGHPAVEYFRAFVHKERGDETGLRGRGWHRRRE